MLNRARIDELRHEVGEDGLTEIVELFCEEVEEMLEDLRDLPPGDMPDRLHSLKGSALNIGMDEVSRLCLAEEARLKADRGATADIAAIRAAYASAKQALDALF